MAPRIGLEPKTRINSQPARVREQGGEHAMHGTRPWQPVGNPRAFSVSGLFVTCGRMDQDRLDSASHASPRGLTAAGPPGEPCFSNLLPPPRAA
jgi:hypothetical protein